MLLLYIFGLLVRKVEIAGFMQLSVTRSPVSSVYLYPDLIWTFVSAI